jgi:hypothetical protein
MDMLKSLSGMMVVILAMYVGQVQAGERIAEFKGSGSMRTAEFEVNAPWILDWRVTSTFSEGLAVDVSLMEAGTDAHLGNVLKTKRTGNGVRMFSESGHFSFRVNSTLANWTLRVEQLTREEAELYQPRQTTGIR